MKDTTSFFCNLDYLLVPIKINHLSNVLKHGLKPLQKPYKSCMEAEPLLSREECGVNSVAIFKQWRHKNMCDLEIDNIDPDTEVVLKIDKSAVLHLQFCFNKCENDGRQDIHNSLVSDINSISSIWKYDVVRNMNQLILNEVIFQATVDSAFIKEVWYFTENEPPGELHTKHLQLKFVNNAIELS